MRKVLGVLAGTALLTAIGAVFSAPSQAAVSFRCENRAGLPTTVAYNSEGKQLEIVKWYSEYFTGSGYDPITRCEQVSGRFQSAYQTGRLSYVTAGIVNGLPVVCATSAGGRCEGSNVLFTLKPGADAAATLQRLFDVRDLGAPALWESDGRIYIDVKKLVASLETGAASSGNPGTAPTGNPGQPSGPAW